MMKKIDFVQNWALWDFSGMNFFKKRRFKMTFQVVFRYRKYPFYNISILFMLYFINYMCFLDPCAF